MHVITKDVKYQKKNTLWKRWLERSVFSKHGADAGKILCLVDPARQKVLPEIVEKCLMALKPRNYLVACAHYAKEKVHDLEMLLNGTEKRIEKRLARFNKAPYKCKKCQLNRPHARKNAISLDLNKK